MIQHVKPPPPEKTVPLSTEADASKKIFVGGLSWKTTDETLRHHFEQYGEVVSAEIMKDKDTGNHRGLRSLCLRMGILSI